MPYKTQLLERDTTVKQGKRTVSAKAYAVRFDDNKGRDMQTLWTTYKSEAEGWQKVAAETGYVSSGRPQPYVAPQQHQGVRRFI